MRLIDADALIMALRLEYPMMPMFKELREEWDIKTEGYRKAEDVIRNAPTIEPKRGKWIWSPRDTDGTVSGCCSNCSFSHLFIGGHTAQYNFCPNCGADMRKGSE